MFCNKCGNQVEENYKFCTKCGAVLDGSDVGVSMGNSTSGSVGSYGMLTIISAIVTIIGVLLPIYSILGNSVSYIEGDGKIIAFFSAISAVLALVKRERFSFIPALVSLLVIIFFATNVSEIKDFGGDMGIGYYLIWAGVIGTIGFSILSLVKRKK